MPSVNWSDIDTNKSTVGYLDSVEVENAKKRGISNVFAGMIQADYEGGIDVGAIVNKYDKGANGRMPYYIDDTKGKEIANLYRELKVLECQYQNLHNEFRAKFGIWDDFLNKLSEAKIIRSNQEYRDYESRLTQLSIQILKKERELANKVDKSLYRNVPLAENPKTLVITVKNRYLAQN